MIRLPSLALGLVVSLLARGAAAQVIEPNGEVVPKLTSPYDEPTYLDGFFVDRGEAIDPVADAAFEPGAFLPACNGGTILTLLLRGSAAIAGLSWYNVPADPTAVPAEVYELLSENTPLGTPVTIDFAADARWTGGAVGFVLTKTGLDIYYSEYRRNVFCSQCSAPDYWKMMLPYPSVLRAGSYYLAFEDWEGANDTSWPNDGDFNDQVFLAEGLRTGPCDASGGAGGSSAAGGTGSGGAANGGGANAGGVPGSGGSATAGSAGNQDPEGGAPSGAGGSSSPDSPGAILGSGTDGARMDPLITSTSDGGCACRASSTGRSKGLLAVWAAAWLFALVRRSRR